MVDDLGGVVAYKDTDSSLIPACPEGGKLDLADGSVIKLLGWRDVDKVLEAFSVLSPEPDWPIWKVERGTPAAPLRTVVIGPKRHVEYVHGPHGPEIVDRTEAALGGMFADPPTMRGRESGNRLRRWTREVALAAIHRAETGQATAFEWDADRPALFATVRHLSVTTPETLRSLPATLGADLGTPFIEGVVISEQDRSVVALDSDGDLADCQELRWLDRRTGAPVRVSTSWVDADGVVVVLEPLAARASRWAVPGHSDPIDGVVVDPLLVRYVGRVSGMIDAQLDEGAGDTEALARRPVYSEPDRLAAAQKWAVAIGPRAFARRTGLPLKVAKRAALGRPIAARSTGRALAALGFGEMAVCECGCGMAISPRHGRRFLSDAHRMRAVRKKGEAR